MDEKSRENLDEVMGQLNNSAIQEDINILSAEDPLLSLKNSIYAFFKLRIKEISKENSFKEIVKLQLVNKINLDEVSVTQLMALYNNIAQVENSSIFTLLDIFKPSKEGAISPLANEVGVGNNINQSTKEVTPEEAETLNLLTALIKNMPKDSV